MDDVTIDFTAIDFETANGSPASACAVGLVRIRDGRVADRATWLIRPPSAHDEFRPFNVQLHGISREMTRAAQPWERQLPALLAFLGDDVLVAHNAGFDVRVLRTACEATDAPCPPYRYVCSLQASRKTYRLDSYRLPNVAAAAGFLDFAHHDATADALACAHIMIDAARRVGADDIVELAMLLGLRVPQIPGAYVEPPEVAAGSARRMASPAR